MLMFRSPTKDDNGDAVDSPNTTRESRRVSLSDADWASRAHHHDGRFEREMAEKPRRPNRAKR